MTKFTVLCQLNGGCMGCCGHDFSCKEKIREAIHKNTLEFNEADPKTREEFIAFRDRAHIWDLREGVCRNLIEKEGQFFCPLHPARNDGDDIRENHCDINHLCRTAKEFSKWKKEKQDSFLKFVGSKELDNLDYSIQMDNNSLLREFLSV